MGFGKTIKIFLIDGNPSGRMTCELSNWTGKAYKVPRIYIKDCNDRADLQNTGIYLLLGKSEEGEDLVYIGEAECIIKRLLQHLAQKDFWNEAIIFISKDENLNKAHIKYLENRLHDITIKAQRYKLYNATIPTLASIAESDRAEMEEYIEHVKLLVNTLGHKLFEEKRELKKNTEFVQKGFYINSARGADAQGQPSSEGFVVFKGSKIANSVVPSFPVAMHKLRSLLLEKQVVQQVGDELKFLDDFIFNSPSTAAAIVMGRSANGLMEWRQTDGRTLKSFETIEEISIM